MFGQKFQTLGKLSLVLAMGISLSLSGCGGQEETKKKTPQEFEEIRKRQIDIVSKELEGS